MVENRFPSLEEQFHTYQKPVYSYIRRRVQDEQDAEDLVSDVFLKLQQTYDRYDPSRAPFSTWLYVIVNNRLKNYYRDTHTHISLERLEGGLEPAVCPDMDQAVFWSQCRKALASAIQKLTEREQKMVILRYFHGASAWEISMQFNGIKESNVRVILHRALGKLKKELKKENFF